MISNIVHPGIVLCYSGVWMNLTIFEVKYPICARPPQPPKRGNEGMKQKKVMLAVAICNAVPIRCRHSVNL